MKQPRNKWSEKYYRQNRKQILARSKARYRKNRKLIIKRSRKYWLSKPLQERRESARRRQVKYCYNLSAAEHDALLKKQNYQCPITGLQVDLFSSIDHDHTCCSGERSCGRCIRGILNRKANSAIGLIPKPEMLIAAAEYLRRQQ